LVVEGTVNAGTVSTERGPGALCEEDSSLPAPSQFCERDTTPPPVIRGDTGENRRRDKSAVTGHLQLEGALSPPSLEGAPSPVRCPKRGEGGWQ
jgi:hypothetical protein